MTAGTWGRASHGATKRHVQIPRPLSHLQLQLLIFSLDPEPRGVVLSRKGKYTAVLNMNMSNEQWQWRSLGKENEPISKRKGQSRAFLS